MVQPRPCGSRLSAYKETFRPVVYPVRQELRQEEARQAGVWIDGVRSVDSAVNNYPDKPSQLLVVGASS